VREIGTGPGASRPAHSAMELGTLRAGKFRQCPLWEIYRDGEPLPARLRDEGFATDDTATAAGKVPLRYFLEGLAEEEG
jgi:hypothetical protein